MNLLFKHVSHLVLDHRENQIVIRQFIYQSIHHSFTHHVCQVWVGVNQASSDYLHLVLIGFMAKMLEEMCQEITTVVFNDVESIVVIVSINRSLIERVNYFIKGIMSKWKKVLF